MNFKNKILSLLLIFTLFIPYQASALYSVAFRIESLTESMKDMIMQNIENSMKQWAMSTAKNGVNSAASGLKECLGNLDMGMFNMGGLDLELPCGQVLSVDNPMDDILNSVSSDISSSFNSFISDNIDNLVDFVDPFENACYKKSLEYSSVKDMKEQYVMDDKEFKESIGEIFSSWHCQDSSNNKTDIDEKNKKTKEEIQENRDNTSSCSCDNLVVGEDLDSFLEKNSISEIGDSSFTSSIQETIRELEASKKHELSRFNKYILMHLKDELPYTYLKNGATIEEITAQELIIDNLKGEEKAELKKQLDKNLSMEEYKNRIKKHSFEMSIPLSFFTINVGSGGSGSSSSGGTGNSSGNTNGGSTSTNSSTSSNNSNSGDSGDEEEAEGLFDQSVWGNNVPANGMVYITPYQLFEEIPIIDRSSGDTKLEKNPLDNSKRKDLYKLVFEPEGLNSVVTKDKLQSIFQSAGVLNKNGEFTGQFNHMTSMNILLKSTDLLVDQIKHKASTNGQSFMNWVYDKAIFNSNFILIDLLEKMRNIDEKQHSMNTNTYSNNLKETIKAISDTNTVILNKILQQLNTSIGL